MIIGKKGQEVDKLTKELEDLTHRHIEVKTMEVNRPEVDPQLVAEDIAEQLAKRASFRRTMKKHIDKTMEAGAKGIKVQMAGRLGGAEMARSERRHGRQHPAVDAAGEGGIRVRRGQDRPGPHRHQGVDQQRRLPGPRGQDNAPMPGRSQPCPLSEK